MQLQIEALYDRMTNYNIKSCLLKDVEHSQTRLSSAWGVLQRGLQMAGKPGSLTDRGSEGHAERTHTSRHALPRANVPAVWVQLSRMGKRVRDLPPSVTGWWWDDVKLHNSSFTLTKSRYTTTVSEE